MTDRRRVLMVVEDDGPTRRALRAIFSIRGWDVRQAVTVSEGLELLARGLEPDCLILDLMLPDGEGESILSDVRVRRLATHIAVCTGTADPIRLSRVRAMGPDALLPKPVDLKTLTGLCETGACSA